MDKSDKAKMATIFAIIFVDGLKVGIGASFVILFSKFAQLALRMA